MPLIVTIAPGEKKTMRAAAVPALSAAALRGMMGAFPRFVQVKVTILRNLEPFTQLIEQQSRTRVAQRLSDAQFDQWFEESDTIFLNTLPVRWSPINPIPAIDASQRASSPGRGRRP